MVVFLARSQQSLRPLSPTLLERLCFPWLLEHTQEELFREGQQRGLPFGIPADSKMLIESPHLKERGYFVEVDHPMTGKILYPGAQVKIGDLPYQLRRAPLLGEHNEEVFSGRMGFGKSDLVKLREKGII